MDADNMWSSFVSGTNVDVQPKTSAMFNVITAEWSPEIKEEAYKKFSPYISAANKIKILLKDINSDPELIKLLHAEIKKRCS